MWVVYLIQHSINQEVYIGVTGNLRKRLKQHNEGLNRSTKRNKGNWILIYAEAFRSRKDAEVRERRLKHHGNAVYELKKRIQGSLLGD